MTQQPPRSRTLGDLLDEMAECHPEGEAVVFDGERLTYRQYRERTRRLARGLHALGVRRGDKVALLMGNRSEWLLVAFAVAQLGATLVPVSTWSTARELEYVLRHADATTLVTVDRFRGQDYLGMLPAIGLRRERLPLLRAVIGLGGERREGVTPFADLWALGDAVPEAIVDEARRAVRPNDVAYILYTSGTTSTPKGVQLEHGDLVENSFHIGARQHLGSADRLWLGVSLFWGFGCENALLARHDSRRLRRPPGGVRARRGAAPDRARAVHSVLRHTQHRGDALGASRPPAPRPPLAPHRRRHRAAAGHAHGDGSRRPAGLQRLRAHRVLWQLRADRCRRPAGGALAHGRSSAARLRHPDLRPGHGPAVTVGSGRRDPPARPDHARLLQGHRQERRRLRRGRLLCHRRPRLVRR